MQRPMIFLIQHGPVRRLIKRMWASALDRYAEAVADRSCRASGASCGQGEGGDQQQVGDDAEQEGRACRSA
jgi:hypothetical protein